MSRIPGYFQLERYNISPRDIVQLAFHCEPELIQPRVVLMPSWRVEIFAQVVPAITEIVPGSVYQLDVQGQRVSVIRSGIGAPQTGDTMLALGCTPCETAIFIGSAGGLGKDVRIGDLVVVERSICGDGFSRYLDTKVIPEDCFQHVAEPDQQLTDHIKNHAVEACRSRSISLHNGTVFSTDSIMAQFFRLDHIADTLDCIGIEMETAAFFNAARLVGIKAGALLQVSDLPGRGKSLFAGRTEQEDKERRIIRQEILSRVVLNSIVFFP